MTVEDRMLVIGSRKRRFVTSGFRQLRRLETHVVQPGSSRLPPI